MKLQQEAQFNPTRKSISSLLSKYGLELISYELADSGIENCTIIVQSRIYKHVLRVYRQGKKIDKAIKLELDFIRYLGDNGIPVAPSVANLDGSFISHIEQNGQIWQAILMQYMPGKHAEHYSTKLLTNLALTQARMHILSISYPLSNMPGEVLSELRETEFIKLIKNRATLNGLIGDFIDRAENYVVTLSDLLPKGLCHLDFDNGNVLSNNDIVSAVLDFDDLRVAPYVMCLAYTLWDIAYDLGLNKITSYIEDYERIRPLTETEKSFIDPIILFRHYVIGCMQIADNEMDEQKLVHYIKLERELLER